MPLLQPKLPYRIGVEFQPPLTTLMHLRTLCKQTNTASSVPVSTNPYAASVIVKFPPGTDLSRIDYGKVWFRVGKSNAVIKTIRPEVNFLR